MKNILARLLASALCLAGAVAQARDYRIDHLEPPSWWAGMEHKTVQLMVHGKQIAALEPVVDYPGVRIESVTRVANKNYLFIDLAIGADAVPGKLAIGFKDPGGAMVLSHAYPLLARAGGSARRAGFGSGDAIYQLMPDRFANGNPANDSAPAMADKPDRKLGHGRHGGDIAGMTRHLDYIAAMGFTQVWPTPLVENDMPVASYHGYAATDHYRIDPRYGSNEEYRRFALEANKRGIGVIQDVVLSHIGSGHWWMKDLPTPDWTNHGTRFVPTRHHRVAVQDHYAAEVDKQNFTTGWFDTGMPDMNQTNPLVANYLIQNNIWWIEYAGLSGLRIDTYSYSDGKFLTEYTRRVMAEYPNLNMVGEEWHKQPAIVSRWQRGKVNFDGYVSSLPSLMDFPMTGAIRASLSGKDGDEGYQGFNDVYETLALDYLYPDPGKLVLFEGNHDMARMFSVVGEDLDLYKMNLVLLMTLPRIPQFYYGTEILMTSSTRGRDDSGYRRDFPGGWDGDKVNAFTGAGLSAPQREAQAFVRQLVNWRKSTPLIHHGKTMHYGAEDGTYVYFRYDGTRKIMVALNKNAQQAVLPSARFGQMLKGVASGRDVLGGKTFDLASALVLPARSAVILQLQDAPQRAVAQ